MNVMETNCFLKQADLWDIELGKAEDIAGVDQEGPAIHIPSSRYAIGASASSGATVRMLWRTEARSTVNLVFPNRLLSDRRAPGCFPRGWLLR